MFKHLANLTSNVLFILLSVNAGLTVCLTNLQLLPPLIVNKLVFQTMSFLDVPLFHRRPPKLLSVKLSKSFTIKWN